MFYFGARELTLFYIYPFTKIYPADFFWVAIILVFLFLYRNFGFFVFVPFGFFYISYYLKM